ncbi:MULTISPECIES: TetR/AcrR family transcriptional regulator [unclassified Rhodococcus (in: high G+C Gram-positive bacteria)]|jgi:AcrR family transcriptional regulator|uniref:TetR/AcrR family transcriptional regulator n=1 Tax=unclassified Rhodococcus (in: high G+C Gram-positive bacteria) TaxID=192944 RepID=UPI001358112B|nr:MULTISPECIES: TetR/AcrR family transcriptional regulator [unclassified Rhodococcus (in: high G+C Gram-positive bacteria)]
MSPVTGPRPGGRSARIQQAVHASTRKLLAERERADITVPMIAADAGVTPSTIYRRWGDITEVFADVAIERLRPETPPRETGSVRGDLVAWAQEYLEEMSSPVGRSALRDIVMSGDMGRPDNGTNQYKCAAFCRSQITAILQRDAQFSGAPGAAEGVIDHVVAPIVYRILFDQDPLAEDRIEALVDSALDAVVHA